MKKKTNRLGLYTSVNTLRSSHDFTDYPSSIDGKQYTIARNSRADEHGQEKVRRKVYSAIDLTYSTIISNNDRSSIYFTKSYFFLFTESNAECDRVDI